MIRGKTLALNFQITKSLHDVEGCRCVLRFLGIFSIIYILRENGKHVSITDIIKDNLHKCNCKGIAYLQKKSYNGIRGLKPFYQFCFLSFCLFDLCHLVADSFSYNSLPPNILFFTQ